MSGKVIHSFKIYALLLLLLTLPLAGSAAAAQDTLEFVSSVLPPVLADGTEMKEGERFHLLRGSVLYTCNYWSGIQLIDISDVHNPRKISFIPVEGVVQHLAVAGKLLFAASKQNGVAVFDVSVPAAPRYVTRIKTAGDALWLAVQGHFLYVAMGMDGFMVIDISDIKSPQTVALKKPGDWVWSLIPHDSLLYVLAKQGGIIIYDSARPAALKKLNQFKTGYQALHLQIEGDYAYVADGPGGLLVLDITSPALPRELARLKTPGFARHIYKHGHYLYLSCRNSGLQIIRINQPAFPVLERIYQSQSESYCASKKDVFVLLTTDRQTKILRHNNAPQLILPADTLIKENQLLSLQVRAQDPDGDSFSLSAANLPRGAAFNARTGLFTWQPDFEQAGDYRDISFQVKEQTGSGLSAVKFLNIAVIPVNRPPDLPALTPLQVLENSILKYELPAANDPDEENSAALQYRAENLPAGAKFDPGSRLFIWQPDYDQSGLYPVDFVVSDSEGGVDRESFIITVVHVDRPPVLQPVADLSVDEGQTLSIVLNGFEPDREDSNRITYQMPGLVPGAGFDPETREFRWQPDYTQAGSYRLSAVLQAGVLADTIHFNITVNPVNLPPEIAALTDFTIPEDSLLTIVLRGGDPDKEDAGKLEFSAANLPPGATFEASRRRMDWRPGFEQAGRYTDIVFKVTDPLGLFASDSVNITVVQVNRPPELESLPVQQVEENAPLSFRLRGSDPDREDSSRLRFLAEGLPHGAALDSISGLFSWIPDFEQAGEHPVTFIISDGKLSRRRSSGIRVQNVNRPPVLQPVSRQQVDEGELLEIALQADDPDAEDAGKLVLKIENLPDGAKFDPKSNTIRWVPGFEQSGFYDKIVAEVSDPAGLKDWQTLSVYVHQVNRKPVFKHMSDITAKPAEKLELTLQANDPDAEDQGKLQYSAAELPAGATLDPATGKFYWIPAPEQNGTFSLNFIVTDGSGARDELHITLTVTDTMEPAGSGILN
ncbi:MAG: putative Ig domain-containing protein [Calditrichia bacterium]